VASYEKIGFFQELIVFNIYSLVEYSRFSVFNAHSEDIGEDGRLILIMS